MESTSIESSIPDALPAVLTAKFNHDGSLIISGGADNQPRVRKTSDGTLCNSYGSMLTNNSQVRDVCLSEDDSRLVACYANGLIVSYDTSTGVVCNHFQGGQHNGVNAAKLNEFGSVLVSAESRCVRLWDCRTNNSKPIQIFDTFTGGVTSLGLRRSEIVAASLDGSVQLFDLRNHKRLCYKLGAPVASFHISETVILASCLDSTIRLLNVGTKSIERERVYKGHTCRSTKVGCCFTPGYYNVVGGSEDGRIFFWKMITRGVDRSFKAHESAVTSVEYHPSDRCILSASTDGSIVLWKEDMGPKHILN